jgi:hypothetical protein
LFASLAIGDVCQFTSGKAVPFDDALDCVNRVPLTEDSFEQTMDTVERAGQLYVFKDIAKKSPAPIFSATNVNLEAELAKIRRTKYQYEYPFNKDIVTLFNKFHDGHFVYVPPTCYTAFSAIQPFVLTSYYDTALQENKIYIAGLNNGAEEGYSSLYKVTGLDKCVGGTIRSVNNVPAVQAVFEYANSTMGSSHDVNIRYNLAMTMFMESGGYYPGEFYYRSVLSKTPEKGEVVNYVIDMPDGSVKSLSLKWIFVPRADLSSLSELTQQCAQTKTNTEHNFQFQGTAIHKTPFVKTSEFGMRTTRRADSDVIIANEDASFYQVDDSTAVLVIPAFMPQSSVRFGRTLTNGFQEMYNRGLSRIIIDISNNGGGIVCWGYTLAHLLLNEYNPFGRADMPVVPLSLAYAQAAIDNDVHDTVWSPDTWHQIDSEDTLPFTMDWFVPGHNHTRGGVEGTYSELFRDQCDVLYKVMHLPEGMSFKPSQIKVVSNGYCFSTCAFFSRHMQESYNIATFATGGVSYIPMGIATSPGNQVLDLDSTIAYAEKLGMKDHPLSPPGFPTTAQMTYTLREVYPWTPTARDIPLDYYFQPATVHLQYTKESSVDRHKVWEQVLEFFD